jgi:hypothetical protein
MSLSRKWDGLGLNLTCQAMRVISDSETAATDIYYYRYVYMATWLEIVSYILAMLEQYTRGATESRMYDL